MVTPTGLPGRIAITGGAGFIGSAIARRLLKEGIPEVVILGRTGQLPPATEEWRDTGRVKSVVCDIRELAAVREALAGCDAVFHQAALRVTQCAREPHIASETLVHGTENVLAACVAHGVRKVVAASSAIVYGDALKLPISESHPVHPTTLYGAAKVQNENLLEAYWKYFRLNFTVLRYFNVYGPGMTLFGGDAEVLIRWLDRLDAGMPPLIFGDGRQALDFVFIDDVVEANWRALLYPMSGDVFNVCSGVEVSLLDLLGQLSRIAGSAVPPEFRPVRDVSHVERRVGDPRKAAELLGFRARVGLEEGLTRLVEWRNDVLIRRGSLPMQSPGGSMNMPSHSV